MNKLLISFGGVVIVLLFVVIGFVSGIKNTQKEPQGLGSVAMGNEYYATTTITGKVPNLVRTGTGVLSSVTITGAAAGVMNIYDATTTNINLRDSTQSTSSITVATFPVSIAAGTYTFDISLSRGLFIDVIGAVVPTSSVMYR